MSSPSWPPTLTPEQISALTTLATTYALSHGLLYLPPGAPQPPAPTSAIHAPLSLLPSPFPRALFDHAHKIASIYNVLYARIAMDWAFLDDVMGAERGAGQVDAFVGELWRGWKSIRDDYPQPLHLGLFRSDYLLHTSDGDGGAPPSLKQVEFNTISSSFGALSERAAALHRYLLAATSSYFGASPGVLKPDNFPPNETTRGLAEGLATAHAAYGNPDASILFVVQPGERNVFDQRWLEYELLERHHIRVLRQTLSDLSASASLSPTTHALLLHPSHPPSPPTEISVVYFRAGYTPSDFPHPATYTARLLLERSRAIKCPSLPLQLAGAKKVQQVLTLPGVLERFLQPPHPGKTYRDDELADLRAGWMGMWALDDDGGVDRARKEADGLVLKPQREGGGNNVYRSSIPGFLDALPREEHKAWIAMELIRPPDGAGNYLVRAGGNGNGNGNGDGDGGGGAVKADVVSELGVFGWALFGAGVGEEEEAGGVKEATAGWLLRTKGRESDEGGVAAGFSVLDSVVLVD
ncbi:glutathione synthase [Punctularia strigosozonata HHB-11173 SS5]|uniref:glutathione synthase n=1 Tax=Punctularia strigosozonata (strain HHB-11173) TaxID=741275 RepID=UPI0004416BFF|nr:glutathione synthase [Punctularia strigosozonata HHB-11173 SS5]EIN12167.1 glutathione synthase [Punctularia strigosozonata HHB-11173 SS5]